MKCVCAFLILDGPFFCPRLFACMRAFPFPYTHSFSKYFQTAPQHTMATPTLSDGLAPYLPLEVRNQIAELVFHEFSSSFPGYRAEGNDLERICQHGSRVAPMARRQIRAINGRIYTIGDSRAKRERQGHLAFGTVWSPRRPIFQETDCRMRIHCHPALRSRSPDTH